MLKYKIYEEHTMLICDWNNLKQGDGKYQRALKLGEKFQNFTLYSYKISYTGNMYIKNILKTTQMAMQEVNEIFFINHLAAKQLHVVIVSMWFWQQIWVIYLVISCSQSYVRVNHETLSSSFCFRRPIL